MDERLNALLFKIVTKPITVWMADHEKMPNMRIYFSYRVLTDQQERAFLPML